MKVRLILLSLLLTLVTSGVNAQNAVVVYQKDGTAATFAFWEKPVVTYAEDNLVLTTSKTTVEYPIYLLAKIAFSEVEAPVGVEDIQANQPVRFLFNGETLTVQGGKPGEQVWLYNLKGMKIGQFRLDSEGKASVPLKNLGKDLYITKVGGVSFKFRKS